MKKSLIALAALGAFGVASAQSSVTLYGVADAWIGQTKDKILDVTKKEMGSGGYNGSRWGLRGAEDLGGGLRGVFQLEQGFSIDTAAALDSTKQFARQAFVGLGGGFGEVRFGRQYGALDEVRGGFSGAFDTAFTPTGDTWKNSDSATAGEDYAARFDNAITYRIPAMGGLTATVAISAGEGTDANKHASFNVRYGAGPLAVALAYQRENENAAQDKWTFLGGSYALGAATLKASYQNQSASTDDAKEFQLGVDVAMGAGGIGVSYARAKNDNDRKATGIGATAFYDLSKRTRMYAGFKAVNAKTAAGVKDYDKNLIAAGVRHSF
jgi:predicted porin